MKKINYLLFAAIALLFSVSVISCSDDDDYSSSDLEGKWSVVRIVGYEKDFEDPEYDEDIDETFPIGQVTYEFYEDGEFCNIDKKENYTDYGEWEIKGNKLYLKYDDEEDDLTPAKILKLTSTEFVFEVHIKEYDHESYGKVYCERMN